MLLSVLQTRGDQKSGDDDDDDDDDEEDAQQKQQTREKEGQLIHSLQDALSNGSGDRQGILMQILQELMHTEGIRFNFGDTNDDSDTEEEEESKVVEEEKDDLEKKPSATVRNTAPKKPSATPAAPKSNAAAVPKIDPACLKLHRAVFHDDMPLVHRLTEELLRDAAAAAATATASNEPPVAGAGASASSSSANEASIPGMSADMVQTAQVLMLQHPQMVQMLAAMPPEQVAMTVGGMLAMPQEQQEQMAQMMGIPPEMLKLVSGQSPEELGAMLQAMLKMGAGGAATCGAGAGGGAEDGMGALDGLDARSNTALLLAIKLGHLDIARYLVEQGANVNVKSDNDWHLLDEAVLTRSRSFVKLVYRRLHQLTWQKWVQRRPELLAALKQIPDFYLEMHWKFDSRGMLLPLVKTLAPSDTYKIWKQGSILRVDSSIVGFR
jgi:hypothetical protein